MVRIGLAAAAAALALAGPATAESFDFVCRGDAVSRTTFKSAFNDFSDRVFGHSSGSSSSAPEQQFRLIIEGEVGRLQTPTPVTPGIADGGTGSWTVLSDIWVRPDVITASWTLNQLNSARLSVDRRDGRTDIDGGVSFTFHGFCRPAPPDVPPHP